MGRTRSSISRANRSRGDGGPPRTSGKSSTAASRRLAVSPQPSHAHRGLHQFSSAGRRSATTDRSATSLPSRRRARDLISSRRSAQQWEAEAQPRCKRAHARRLHQDGIGTRTRRRCAPADAATVQVRRRRSCWFRSAVLAVDSSDGLDRSRAVGNPHRCRRGSAERDGAGAGTEHHICARARAGASSSVLHACARLRAALLLGEMADALLLVGAARGAGEGGPARASRSAMSPHRRCARCDLRDQSPAIRGAHVMRSAAPTCLDPTSGRSAVRLPSTRPAAAARRRSCRRSAG